MACIQQDIGAADDMSAANFNLPGGYSEFSELDQLYSAKNSKHTEAVVTASLKVLTDYCARMETTLALVEQKTPAELCEFLQAFYTGVRRKCGQSYAKRSMFTLRYGLRRHFQKVLRVDIASNAEFKPANDVFFTVLSHMKNSVKKDYVHNQDLARIYVSSVTDCTTPRGLQNKVFLDLMLNLCCSGRRNLRGMKKSHFTIMTEFPTNRRFVSFDKIGNMKNSYRDGEDESDDGNESDEDVSISMTSLQNRMYATPERAESCPVLTFEKYVTKLNPACESLWQRAKKFCPQADQCWYDATPLGKNGLGNKMKEISAEAGCSKIYSNISLKVTSKLRVNNSPIMSGKNTCARYENGACEVHYFLSLSSNVSKCEHFIKGSHVIFLLTKLFFAIKEKELLKTKVLNSARF